MGGRGPVTVSPWAGLAPPPTMELAVCAQEGRDPELWFDNAGTRAHMEAVALCLQCPELTVCREWALEQDDRLWGTWGALSRPERRLIRKVAREA